MKIGFHGAAHTVTGSQHLLQVNGYRILLECGLYQGKRKVAIKRNRDFPFDPAKLDAVILSHAHIDHSGNLPNLVKSGFRGPIYATPATCHLANIMLLDSAHIQETDANNINFKNAKKGLPPVEPLYTIEDAGQVALHFNPISYHQPFEVVSGVNATLFDAGHILGSAAVALEIDERGPFKQRNLRLWFSGDIGRRDLPLIRDPELPDRAEAIIMECTYGDKPHDDPELAYQELRQVVQQTIQRGGKVIIPAFAVGRTQELVYKLNEMMAGNEVPRVPVFVDSPLAVNASEIFRAHTECFDEETAEFVNDRKDPMIIISASGMAENGRIRHHLKYNIENPRNTILIVSWQAPETLGRRLAEREKQVKIFGETYEVRAQVETIGGLSAHAGQNFLLEYALSTQASARQIFLVHGEAKPAQILTQKLAEQGQHRVAYPELHSVVEI
jgi:metallo-beta-lactamase family protein